MTENEESVYLKVPITKKGLQLKKALIITLISIVSIIVLLFGLVVIALWESSTKKVEAVANQFKPDSSWQLVDSRVNPPRVICLQADCNEVTKSWKLPKNITTKEFIAVIKQSGWGDMVKPDVECTTSARFTGSSGQTMCEANGMRDGFYVHVSAEGNRVDDTQAAVLLWVERRSRS